MDHIRNNSYLGKKGYTISKSCLNNEELEFIKNDLFMKPFTAIKVKDDNSPFPSYRENDKKIYIPRFYGIERYGLPDNTDISPGLDISLSFSKTLRDYQIDIVNTYINYVNTPIVPSSSFNGNASDSP